MISATTSTVTTTTEKVTTTKPPSKDLEEKTKSAKVEFAFVEDYEATVGNSVTDFNNKVKQDIVNGAGIQDNNIKNFKSEKGMIHLFLPYLAGVKE